VKGRKAGREARSSKEDERPGQVTRNLRIPPYLTGGDFGTQRASWEEKCAWGIKVEALLRPTLVPKLLFGNGFLRNSVSPPLRNRSFGEGIPKQEFGNEETGLFCRYNFFLFKFLRILD
jgi:hypothetical protein